MDRADVFVESKIWISDYGYQQTLHGYDKSARKLGVDRIDLLILHQPLPSQFAATLQAYRALETLLADGNVGQLFVVSYAGGAVAGLLTAAAATAVRRRVEDALLENVVILLTPFVAYLLAEEVNASGVLAVVVAGLVMSQTGPRIGHAAARTQTAGFWSLSTYLLNGALFVLVGLELPAAVRGLTSVGLARGILAVLAVSVVLVLVRFVFLWVSARAIGGTCRISTQPGTAPGVVAALPGRTLKRRVDHGLFRFGMRQGDAVQRNPDIEALVQRFYDLMRTGGSPARLLSPQLTVAVGTDDEEWWDDYGAVITAYVTQFAAMGPCTVQASSPRGYSQGEIGWFEDRALFTLHDGESVPVRFTGVVRREHDTWRAVQTHVSIGTPNAELHLDLPT